ncbi:MAG: hypothetical protein BJ554DRAFT_2887 [Olpidium bornovanus]|uniref:Uncharacterized protein n=1 Tax=Olpidium bornovanus TaxID=278681 RepID=A0A8H8A2I3_9FUNG|nr:MAG: hypothetical protein BJ554DRAFT_2887 [Olpidium bornovanus]
MGKMARAFRHGFTTRKAFKVPVDGTGPRIEETPFFWLVARFIHGLWIFNLCHRHGLGFFRRQNAELHYFHAPEERGRGSEESHDRIREVSSGRGNARRRRGCRPPTTPNCGSKPAKIQQTGVCPSFFGAAREITVAADRAARSPPWCHGLRAVGPVAHRELSLPPVRTSKHAGPTTDSVGQGLPLSSSPCRLHGADGVAAKHKQFG